MPVISDDVLQAFQDLRLCQPHVHEAANWPPDGATDFPLRILVYLALVIRFFGVLHFFDKRIRRVNVVTV